MGGFGSGYWTEQAFSQSTGTEELAKKMGYSRNVVRLEDSLAQIT